MLLIITSTFSRNILAIKIDSKSNTVVFTKLYYKGKFNYTIPYSELKYKYTDELYSKMNKVKTLKIYHNDKYICKIQSDSIIWEDDDLDYIESQLNSINK